MIKVKDVNNRLGYEFSFEIKQELIHYDPIELEKWKQGDPAVVPPEVFLWKGPGRENGYGYGEHVAKRYLINQGFQVLVNNFNLFPVKKSKFAKNNEIIKEVIGEQPYKRLQKGFGFIINKGLRIEHPDICVLRPDLFFVEVKRDSDRLREPQIMFAAVVSAVLGIPFKVYKVLPYRDKYNASPIIIKQELPEEVLTL